MSSAHSRPSRRSRPSRPRGRLQRRAALLLTAAVVVALTGCGGGSADLAGNTYVSTASQGHELVPGSAVTLTFTEGRISANAGCNTMNGSATWEGDTLEVTGPLASTMMACEEALMAQDQWLSQFLASSPALSLEGADLTVGDDSEGLTLTEKA